MKKKRLKNLSLHKESISKFQFLVKGGIQDTMIRCAPSIIVNGINLCITQFVATCPGECS